MDADLTWDTADVKTCPHGYVFYDACPDCKDNLYRNNPFKRPDFKCRHGHEVYCKECYEECQACGGEGELRVPKTYFTCPCCRDREKTRTCRYCNGKGYL